MSSHKIRSFPLIRAVTDKNIFPANSSYPHGQTYYPDVVWPCPYLRAGLVRAHLAAL